MNDRSKRRAGQLVGQVKEITSLSNPVIKDIKGLAQKKNRDATDRFIAEGFKLVLDALEQGWTIQILIYAKSEAQKPLVQQTAAKVVAQSGLVLEVSEKVLSSITRRDNPQAVIGVFEKQLTPLDKIEPKIDDTYIALDRVRDPGNLGTIIRTADAVGASGIILLGNTTDPFSIETVRATMGSIFQLPIATATNDGFLSWADSKGCFVVGSHLKGSVDYRQIDFKAQKTILLMGNEQAGLPDDLSDNCSKLARIPQVGGADSLNLAIATALMSYEARRHLLSLNP